MHRLLLILVACGLPSFAQINSNVPQGSSVTNNPVSLVIERKQVQTLTDGTHISNITHEYYYRDSLGRTRTENEFSALGGRSESIRSVSVQDPVAGTMWNWQSGRPGEHKEYSRATFTPARQFPPPMPNPGAVNARPQGTQPSITVGSSISKAPETKREDLGILDVQGASCRATRNTTTFPIDTFGNDRPITTTQERCISQEFGRVLQENYEDPRTGTRSVTVQSLSRGEPDPSLFQPPADYTEHVQPSYRGR